MKRRYFLKMLSAAAGLLGIGSAAATVKEKEGAVITIQEFNEWMMSFMVYGSDQKEMICDTASFRAICSISHTIFPAFSPTFRLVHERIINGEKQRLEANERWFFTPYGFIKLRMDIAANGITVLDPPVRERKSPFSPTNPVILANAESQRSSIKEIRV
jgi:hypothetical protein